MTTRPERWTRASEVPDMWVDPAEDRRDVGPTPEGERATVLSYLHAYRHTLRMTCDELMPEQLARRSVPPSTVSLLGLVRHPAEVEVWERACAGTDAMVAETDDLGTLARDPDQPVALPDVLVHLVEEYARHCGHADLLRECIDGRVGQ